MDYPQEKHYTQLVKELMREQGESASVWNVAEELHTETSLDAEQAAQFVLERFIVLYKELYNKLPAYMPGRFAYTFLQALVEEAQTEQQVADAYWNAQQFS